MFVCSQCQYSTPKWQGKCLNCNSWNTLTQEIASTTSKPLTRPSKALAKINDIVELKKDRILSKFKELNAVFGGGIVYGSVSILTGDPGVGKSTLAMQVADSVAEQGFKVIYFSSEESLTQLKKKLLMLNLEKSQVFFSEESGIEGIIDYFKKEKPDLCIIDSIQNCTLEDGQQNFFGLNALKESVFRVVQAAKEFNVAVVMTGHITKDGFLAGPKILEHLIDAVFYLQDEVDFQRKILTSVKNRFGSIDEVGFFEMNENGFRDVANVNLQILEETNIKSIGSVLFLSFKGSRAVLSEFQSLCQKTKNVNPQRVSNGVDLKKIILIAAVLEKYLKIELSAFDIFFKIRGGLKLSENLSDLAISLSLLSSYFKKPVDNKTIGIGEIHLNGKISSLHNAEKLIKSAEKLGIERILLGGNAKEAGSGKMNVVSITHVYNLLELFSEK